MKITPSQFAGFCDGVRRAYEMVAGLNVKKMKQPVFVLGSLVHNADVVAKIEEKGIRKIDRDAFFSARSGEIGTVIITAHGDGPEVLDFAKNNNINVIDTTCPKVIRVQRLAKFHAERGYKIILVGDRDHKEVRGIDSWGGGKSLIISGEKDLENIKIGKEDKVAILTQTTQNKKFFEEIVRKIEEKFPEKKKVILDTICETTGERQNEIRKMAGENDVVLVVGSKGSANSTRLFKIARSINPKTYFFENASEMKKEWFIGAKNTAVTAGASTPPWIIEEIFLKISEAESERA
jgi:4-hydroxy-3-methylbut-2-enyl diphosphate reductase